jgi:hypothetical protein
VTLTPEERELLALIPALSRVGHPRLAEALAIKARVLAYASKRAPHMQDMLRAAKVERVRRETGAKHPRQNPAVNSD